ncbi:hypothetical protein Tco_1374106 [Tanacetum coccineum]
MPYRTRRLHTLVGDSCADFFKPVSRVVVSPPGEAAPQRRHSASSEWQVRADKKALIGQGIMSLRRGSWQLLVALLVCFPRSCDPGEACHTERGGSIPCCITMYMMEIARILAVVAKAAVVAISLRSESARAPHPSTTLYSSLQEFSSPEDPSFRSPCFLSLVVRLPPNSMLVGRLSLTPLLRSPKTTFGIFRAASQGGQKGIDRARHHESSSGKLAAPCSTTCPLPLDCITMYMMEIARILAVVAKAAVVAISCLALRSESACAPHPRTTLYSSLQECSSPEDPSFRSPCFLSPVGRSTAQVQVGR